MPSPSERSEKVRNSGKSVGVRPAPTRVLRLDPKPSRLAIANQSKAGESAKKTTSKTSRKNRYPAPFKNISKYEEYIVNVDKLLADAEKVLEIREIHNALHLLGQLEKMALEQDIKIVEAKAVLKAQDEERKNSYS